MLRAASALALVCLMQASPAMAMPNAFWIFGFHVPGKHGVKSDVVTTAPAIRVVVGSPAPLPASTVKSATSS